MTTDQSQNSGYTHALIIGVGRYQHLSGGDQPAPADFDIAQLLGQLTSPARSAELMAYALADLSTKHQLIKPLGSIELLVSPVEGQEVFQGIQYLPATIKNIRLAYRRWYDHCNESKDNVALFYYCGHGIEKIEQYLLAEDFAADSFNPWEGCFPFDSTRRAFHRCQAQTQLFFVDACRQITSDMLVSSIPVNPLQVPSLMDSTCRYNLTQKAAAPMEAAFGQPDAPSYYTASLVAALYGQVASNENNKGWTVSTGALCRHMNLLMQEIAPEEGYEQRCETIFNDSTDIIRLDGPPTIRFDIQCDPAAAERIAEITVQDIMSNYSKSGIPPGPWSVMVPAGVYSIAAQFRCGSYHPVSDFAFVNPPFSQKKLHCHGAN